MGKHRQQSSGRAFVRRNELADLMSDLLPQYVRKQDFGTAFVRCYEIMKQLERNGKWYRRLGRKLGIEGVDKPVPQQPVTAGAPETVTPMVAE